ncbi:MAG: ribosome recycling factor [Lentimonas sp.]|jgi:ribosome recycling factor
MEPKDILNTLTEDFKKSVAHTIGQFTGLHAGKASPSMLDSVRVTAYGSTVSLKEVSAVTTPDAKTIMVQPWDKSIMRNVEKGIQEANLGLNPIVDGGILRVPVPELTGERRQELAKTAGKIAEDGRVSIRQARRDALDLLKAAKNESLSEDDFKRYEKEVQKLHDDRIAEINQLLSSKEKELQTV